MDFKDIVKSRREKLGLTMEDVAKAVGVSKATIHRYESGDIKNIRRDKINALAKVLRITPGELMGWDDLDSMTAKVFPTWLPGEYVPDNIIPIPKTKKVPRLGTIACGEPILAEENVDGFDYVPEDINCDFSLICKGDSMINARILDGDIVYIRQQPTVENGEIAAVLVDNEATLKRVYINGDTIILQPENTAYQPMVYAGEKLNDIRILGKAVYFFSKVR